MKRIQQDQESTADAVVQLITDDKIEQQTDRNATIKQDIPQSMRFHKKILIFAFVMIIIAIPILLKLKTHDQQYFHQIQAFKTSDQLLQIDEQHLLERSGLVIGQLIGSNDLTVKKRIMTEDTGSSKTSLYFEMQMTSRKSAQFKIEQSEDDINSKIGNMKEQRLDPTLRLDLLGFTFLKSPFSFQFSDFSSQSGIFFELVKNGVQIDESGISLTFKIPSSDIYGFKDSKPFRIQERQVEIGTKQGASVLPFLLIKTNSRPNDYIGMFFDSENNSNVMVDVDESDNVYLTYKTSELKASITFYAHGNPEEMISLYQLQEGTPKIMDNGLNSNSLVESLFKSIDSQHLATQIETNLRTCMFESMKFGTLCYKLSLDDDSSIDQQMSFANINTDHLIQNKQVKPAKGKMVSHANSSDKSYSLIFNMHNSQAEGTILLNDNKESNDMSSNQTYEYYYFSMQSNSIQSFFKDGLHGSSSATLQKIQIQNAEQLSTINSACMFTNSLEKIPINFDYSSEEQTLSFSVPEDKKFNEVHSIHFSRPGELNLCDPMSFNYKITDGLIPDISNTNQVSIKLTHEVEVLPDIQVDIKVLENEILNIKWTWASDSQGNFPPSGKRIPFDVPQEVVSTLSLQLSQNSHLGQYLKIKDQPFQIQVFTNNDASDIIFELTGMIYDEYLNWINTRAHTEANEKFRGVFGLGERANVNFFYKDGIYTMWNYDSTTPDETGTLPGNNMYGTHPFYMYKHAQKQWVGVFQKIANAQDWQIKNNQTGGYVDLSQIATGGYADIFIMQGSTPDEVISTYFKIVGNPVLIPQWSLGWNQCRWGYHNLNDVKKVLNGYITNEIPLDVKWVDIDYMNGYRNFEYDPVNFAGLPEFADYLHSINMKFVPILDAGTAYRPGGNYTAFNEGVDKDVFIKINNNSILIGDVWPKDAAYPDFFANNTAEWWKKYLSEFWNTLNFDGLWEDMNEASNFCNGICYADQTPVDPVKKKLPYTPTGRDLETRAMTVDGYHQNGHIQLDTHSLFGTMMVKNTHEWFQSQNRRTMLIERSSFSGAGKFTSRWGGDNYSTQQQMGYSVLGVMLMNMFGITLSGSDICGFTLNTTPELCTKWHIVGSFTTFSRNHNNWWNIDQEPYVFANSTVDGKNALDVMKDAIKNKYSLIRYYYSNMFEISVNGTGTFYKPLFFEFPEDILAFDDIMYNVMLGDSLKLSINPANLSLYTNGFYFPAGLWCGFSGSLKVGQCFQSVGQYVNLPCGNTDYQLHIREGKIVPFQDTKSKKFNTSIDLQDWPVDFHILGQQRSNGSWEASGQYLNDDGQTLDYSGKYNHYEIIASQDTNVTIEFSQIAKAENYDVLGCSAVNKNDYLQSIYIYNSAANKLDVMKDAKVTLNNGTMIAEQLAYDVETDRLIFTATEPICMSTIAKITLN